MNMKNEEYITVWRFWVDPENEYSIYTYNLWAYCKKRSRNPQAWQAAEDGMRTGDAKNSSQALSLFFKASTDMDSLELESFLTFINNFSSLGILTKAKNEKTKYDGDYFKTTENRDGGPSWLLNSRLDMSYNNGYHIIMPPQWFADYMLQMSRDYVNSEEWYLIYRDHPYSCYLDYMARGLDVEPYKSAWAGSKKEIWSYLQDARLDYINERGDITYSTEVKSIYSTLENQLLDFYTKNIFNVLQTPSSNSFGEQVGNLMCGFYRSFLSLIFEGATLKPHVRRDNMGTGKSHITLTYQTITEFIRKHLSLINMDKTGILNGSFQVYNQDKDWLQDMIDTGIYDVSVLGRCLFHLARTPEGLSEERGIKHDNYDSYLPQHLGYCQEILYKLASEEERNSDRDNKLIQLYREPVNALKAKGQISLVYEIASRCAVWKGILPRWYYTRDVNIRWDANKNRLDVLHPTKTNREG